MKKTLSILVTVAVLALVAQSASAFPVYDAPDAGTSSMLFGAALGGLALMRRFLR